MASFLGFLKIHMTLSARVVGCSNAEEKRLQPKNIVRKPGLTFSYQEWMKYNKNVKK